MGKSAWEKEWDNLIKREEKYLKRHEADRESRLSALLADKVPKKLQGVLDAAFYKGFWLVFSKGSSVIEKACAPEKQREDFKIREFAASVKKDRKTLRAFTRTAKGGSRVNVAISAAEGVGLGLLGIGVPDIPLFLAMLLKGVYQIALAYGFEYDSQEERYFILKLIETAMEDGGELRGKDALINQMLYQGPEAVPGELLEKQIKTTSQVLSEELLYMKFIQGLPLVGVIGGAGDAICMKRITDYAALKYQKRFLIKKK